MIIFDANMVLRYLLDDNKEMAEKAEQYINTGDVYVTTEVIAEVVYVLKGVYSIERDNISVMITGFLDVVECQEKDVLKAALSIYGTYNLDFVDCILYGYHIVKGAEIATFDKKLLKLISR